MALGDGNERQPICVPSSQTLVVTHGLVTNRKRETRRKLTGHLG